jgi:hypothetical protein
VDVDGEGAAMKQRRYAVKGLKEHDNDPLSGMANLFDLAMVFAVALMVALVVHFKMTELLTQDNVTMVKNPGKENMEIIVKKGKKIERYKGSQSTGQGGGKRIGTAYELENGEIIYVPE